MWQTINKEETFQSKVILISAEQRAGKTSLACAIANNLYRYCGKALFSNSARDILDLNKRFGYSLNLPPQQHFIYSNTTFMLDPEHKIFTHDLNPRRVGLCQIPEQLTDYDHFPYGSYLIIDESDEYFPNREWSKTPYAFINFLKYVGHNGITVIMICQKISRLDKAIRELLTDQFFVRSSVFKPKKFLFWTIGFTSTWRFLYAHPQQIQDYENLKTLGIQCEPPAISKCKYTFEGDIRLRYNHRAGRYKFLIGLKRYHYGNALNSIEPDLHPAFISKVFAQLAQPKKNN